MLHQGFLELREYTLQPKHFADFINISTERSDLRQRLLPFLGMFTCDLGGTLNRVVHLYHYNDFDERDSTRRAAAQDPQWKQYVHDSRNFVAHQESSVYLPAVPVLHAAHARPIHSVLQSSSSPRPPLWPPPMYELRTYQLSPGYGSVPKLIQAFQKGIPHKIAADKSSELIYFGYTDVGILNNVIELWRYPSAAGCMQARQSARKVAEWKEAIGAITPGVQTFRSSFLHPLPFSRLQ